MEPLTAEETGERTPARRPIVVGVDGSAVSRAALRWAAGQAVLLGAPLRVVHAIDVAENYSSGRRTVESATGVARELAPSVTVRCATPMTSARAALLDEARGAALLVLGRSGRSSIALHVAKHAACPVVLVNEPAAPAG